MRDCDTEVADGGRTEKQLWWMGLPFGEALTKLESRKKKLQNDLENLTPVIPELKATLENLEQEAKDYEKTVCEKRALSERCRMSHEERLVELMEELHTHGKEVDELKHLKLEQQQMCEELSCQEIQLQRVKETQQRAMEQIVTKQQSHEWLGIAQMNLTHQMHVSLQEIVDYQRRLVQQRASIESRRKKSFNCMQDLKGNVRVFCRIRPPLKHEVQGDSSSDVLRFSISEDSTSVQIQTPGRTDITGQNDMEESYGFALDKVFGPTATQAEIFAELGQLVQSALDGYHVGIFAYGQTGSGKTHTMEGPENALAIEAATKRSKGTVSPSSELGMIPRAIHHIFESIEDLKSKGWQCLATVSVLEIYNETIRDLLDSGSSGAATAAAVSSNSSSSGGGGGGRDPCSDIKLDSKGNVTNLRTVRVSDSAQVMELLAQAARCRSSAATASNDRSSRSHSVFQMTLTSSNTLTGNKTNGMMSLIDLAGSERVSQSHVHGERLKEAQNINKSLSSLGDVIAAIATKQPFVPFRNSKLTMLLKDSLGGSAKTLMLVNVSPLRLHCSETLNSLRFATKVNACTLGAAAAAPPKRRYNNNTEVDRQIDPTPHRAD